MGAGAARRTGNMTREHDARLPEAGTAWQARMPDKEP